MTILPALHAPSSDRRPRYNSRDNGFRRDQKPAGRERRDSGNRKGTRKPYGYDSFKPARSREDSSDFFWNEEDLDKNR